MENNNKEITQSKVAADKKEFTPAYITRPVEWKPVNMGYIKSKLGMLNNIEFKIVILTCKTTDEAVASIKLYRQATQHIVGGNLTTAQVTNNENVYLAIKKLLIALENANRHTAPAVTADVVRKHDDEDEEAEEEAPGKSEEEIEEETKEYEEYEKDMDENAENNAKHVTKKSERYK